VPFESVDILLQSPVSFNKAYKRRKMFSSGEVSIPTVALEDLIRMKRKAGRLQDLQDVAILRETVKIKKKRR
jgi:hypothetical protein